MGVSVEKHWLKPEFDVWRKWVDEQRHVEKTWDAILLGGKPQAGLSAWFSGMEEWNQWPALGTTEEERHATWAEIVKQKREWEEVSAREGKVPLVIGREGVERVLTIPKDKHSSWVLYRQHLEKEKWKPEAINSIEASSFRILRRLRFKTEQPHKPIRGMVVGHVQSGKTASMAGLIAMAADWQWNVVIVLTGTIENLREQTESRLVSDLNHGGNLHLHKIDYPSLSSANGSRAQDLNLGSSSRVRYLIVTLKNKSRLEDLTKWLNDDAGSLSQMRILIIDDEADQASIDTSAPAAAERSAINKAIIGLTQVKAGAVNYVAYTATPYANFLNEAERESLYPQDFIIALPQSDEHFGPKQVFGIADTDTEGGLGIVNGVKQEEIESLRELHKEKSASLPESLTDSVCWFLCGVAAMRAYGDLIKPVSMLIHTSAQQTHHNNVAAAVRSFLEDTAPSEIEKRCEKLWKVQTEALTKKKFEEFWPGYGRISQLRDYPGFNELLPGIRELLKKLSHMKMVADNEKERIEYHTGIHLCIDNCANNGLNDENEHVRLKYPSKQEVTKLGFAPAFIIVGGSTLSRGLTIENLISTFFLRAGAQMDTLMQMGRWFGFRPGYELIPRIWMPADTRAKFAYMASVESDLREDLARFMDQGADPREYGPRVRAHPKASWLRPTARNRMQNAQPADYDFSGVNRQTTIFHTAPAILEANVKGAEALIQSLGAPEQSVRKGVVVWRGVDFQKISAFLKSQTFHPRLGYFSDIAPFIEWFEKNKTKFEPWSVLVAGPEAKSPSDKTWKVGGAEVGLAKRTRLASACDDDSAAIGVLRDPTHLLADAKAPIDPPANATNVEISNLRTASGLGTTPQLLLYRIDGQSKAKPGSETRKDLDLAVDPVGISIWIPDGDTAEQRKSYVTRLTVKLPAELVSDDDDATVEEASAA